MHIAMVARTFSADGGLELYTHKLVEGLLEQGIQVTVLCTQNTSALTHSNLQIYKFRRSVAKFKAQRLVEEFYSANEVLAELTASGSHFDIIHSQHQPMEKTNVVTFHNHTVKHLSRAGLPWENALNSLKSKFIPAYRLRNYFDHILYKAARCRIYTSCATRDDFISAYSGASLDALQVVAYPGADLETVSTPLKDKQLDNSFLFVGKGYRKKGLDVLLAACALLKKNSTPFKLLVAGLPKRLIYDIQLRAAGISDNVEFLGFQSDMDAVYRRCSYFVMPSRVEPFGMAAIQAMRYGIVPIVTKTSGVSEILSHKHDALILSDHLSAQELASHMIQLVQDKELSKSLAAQAIVTAGKLTWGKTVKDTLNAYNMVLGVAQKSTAVSSKSEL